jgi:hypothetical protein
MVSNYISRGCLVVTSALVCALLSTSVALATGDADTASCPNEAAEGFRDYLPACRAYELVSPPFKDGLQVQQVMAIAPDGAHLIGESLGTFAAAQSNYSGTQYKLSRTGTGWTSESIAPHDSEFPANRFLASAPEAERTLWELRRTSQSIYAQDLYVREQDGAFVEVGPMIPPALAAGPTAGFNQTFGYLSEASYTAASADLSHVLFTAISSVRWPGDTTRTENDPSLYEYTGTGNAVPRLVGVSDGATVVNGEALAPGRLISDCGTVLGSELDTYNAVSADGNVVLFTAQGHDTQGCESATQAPAVKELYARVDGIQTVPISEPTPIACEQCNTTAPAAAEFQGASRDGSKIFFLSEQELLPGATKMNLYEYDFSNPRLQKLLRVSGPTGTPEVSGVMRVSEDGSHVYFVARGVLAGENHEHHAPAEGAANMYVFERDAAHPGGHITFVATLAPGDASDWMQADMRPVQTTPDGRFVVFQSVAQLTPNDSSVLPQIFEYDAATEELVRVSTGQAGFANGIGHANNHPAEISEQRYIVNSFPSEAGNQLAISADGASVLFSSTGALTEAAEPAEALGATSVYEYRSHGAIGQGNVFLISGGADAPDENDRGALPRGLDASGNDAFFTSVNALLGVDGDSQVDVYDARVAGGFASAGTGAGCEPAACAGPASLPLMFGAPASMGVAGASTATPPAAHPGPPAPVRPSRTTKSAQRRKLARALQACKRRAHRARLDCEQRARRRYAGKQNLRSKGQR